MDCVEISLSPLDGRTAKDESHRLGNIADDIWPDMILHDRYEIRDELYVAVMRSYVGRTLRKKERDELIRRIHLLNTKDPTLDAKLAFLD